jgi:hypothetical protein
MVCGDFQGCYDQCRASPNLPQTVCMLQCSGAERPCAECVVGGVIGCTVGTCARQADAMLSCFQDCPDSACIANNCVDPIVQFDTCSSPFVEAGDCDASVVACNVSL